MTVAFRSLPGSLGGAIDMDLSEDMSDETMCEIANVFYSKQLLVIPKQNLTLSQFDRFTRAFGVQRPHFLDHLRMDDHPSILMLSNIYESGRQLGIYEGACFWHTDVAYEDPPNSATIVYAIKVPQDTPTYVADMYGAYDALPDAMKRRIDKLVVLHHYGNRDDTVDGSPTAAERLRDDQKARVTNVYHPLVIRHPITGRNALYGVAGSSFGIVGMPDDEALGLLRELKDHATQSRFSTAYEYSPGDIVCWDTLSTLHRAPAQKRAEAKDAHARLLWRVSVSGYSKLVQRQIADTPAGTL
jgi:taurine dioxygenase